MPRIDPKQLLKTLGILLSNDGGIKSKDEVARLAQLMQKFSKKLVSKCIYVHILRATESILLEEFLNENGWDLINQWFYDALKNQNLALALEIMGLFLVCPMTKELLKANSEINHAPRLINQLRKDRSTNLEMKELAEKVYRKWVHIISPYSSNSCALKDGNISVMVKTNKIRINKVRKVTTIVDSENQKPLPRIIIKVPPPKPLHHENESLSNENKYTASLIDDDKSILVKKTEPVETSSPMETDVVTDQEKTFSEVVEESKENIDNNDDDDNNMKPADQMSGGSLSLLQSLAEEVSDNLKKEDSVAVENNINFKSNEHKPDVKASKDSARENAKLESITKKECISIKSLSPPPPIYKEESSKPKKIKRDRPHHPRDEVNDDQKLHIRAMAKKLKEEAQAKKDKETLKVISGEKMGRIPKIPKKQPVVEPPEKKEVSKKAGTKSFSDLLVGLDSKPKTVKTPLNRNKTAALLEGLSNTKPSKSSSSNSKLSVPSESSKLKIKDKKDIKETFSLSTSVIKKDVLLPKKESPKPATNGSLSTESSSSSYKSKKVESSGDSPKTKKDVHNFHESTSFMDAIFSSMGQSDIPRKKRRRLSDKDESSSPKQSKTDLTSEKKKVEDIKESESDNAKTPSPPPVFSFYRDTLDDEPAKEEAKKDSDEINEGNNEDLNTKEEGGVMVKEASQSPDTSLQLPEQNKSEDDLPFEEPTNPLPREVKGILVYHRGKEKRNKAISWKTETDLASIRYFELDETERVNVNKLKYDFKNMMKMEFEIEKAALKSKGTLEEEVSKWYKPIPITVDNRSLFKPGGSSKEKTIQALREAEVLQAIYFSKESVPDTPSEVDSSELLSESPVPPVRIPLDDKEGILEESVKDFSKGGWPIPKVNDIDRESSLENSFSLPPSLSNFLSSIGSNTLQGMVPPNMASLSQEEQNTLAAQALAMQKMGMIPPVTATVTPQSEGVVFQPSVPHHPIQQRPQLHQMSEPPLPDHYGGGHFNNGPPHPPNHPQFEPPNNIQPPGMQPPMMNNDFHPNNFNNPHQHRLPPPHHQHHPYGVRGGGGYHNGGPRGGGGRFNDRQNGYRPKDHRDNRDYRDRSRDHPNQHMMGGRRDHSPRVCKFFAQRGHCRDGERCRFLHDR
ncbi:uncharacterized protein [Lepeophtheirus salmonis]|uniref:uncharacterized protein n=1 Tax=Lepeophtheirus salmonis TaxID=72036 RepID=UPI001AE69FDC|nr:serine/threonine-protein phosphatase 1 regulatory subunit 10-like [Lepeophtheirus salmonis]XP_040580129.1 serine/threonine-protein phosphatase 1 regulatory subunit 10-like [Lepeophtheirus salmonis]